MVFKLFKSDLKVIVTLVSLPEMILFDNDCEITKQPKYVGFGNSIVKNLYPCGGLQFTFAGLILLLLLIITFFTVIVFPLYFVGLLQYVFASTNSIDCALAEFIIKNALISINNNFFIIYIFAFKYCAKNIKIDFLIF